ncbi:MAG: rRNA pseudouridine synthase [Bacteroidales bacterium]|nr:rRNA pseudouridine synthase [Bacteroidales bacterium]
MEKKGADKPKTRQFGAKRSTKSTETKERTPRTRRSKSTDDSEEPKTKRTYRKKSEETTESKPKRSFRKSNEDAFEKPKTKRTFKKKENDSFDEAKPKRSFRKKDNSEHSFSNRKFGAKRGERKSFRKTEEDNEAPKRKRRDVTAESPILSEIVARRIREGRQSPQRQKVLSLTETENQGLIRLNKYIANAGVCSRREADVLITTGAVSVNGEIVTELGYKVLPTDEVRYGDKILQNEKPVYLLLNKPKDYITTTCDERGRKDVMELVRGACKERIYPVGRLDKNTTGLLLFTNDGDLTKKLTHPKHGIEKTYAVELNKNFANIDMCALRQGIELEDGIITPDEVAYVGESKRDIGITIHSGKNRIVRRIFEFLGYDVVKLDRVVFAGLTKKDLPRGKWRFLTQAEINILKMTVK